MADKTEFAAGESCAAGFGDAGGNARQHDVLLLVHGDELERGDLTVPLQDHDRIPRHAGRH